MRKLLLLCGILTPLVYVFTVSLGGILTPGYSHIAQAVSDLIAAEAPAKSLLDPLFAIYNLLMFAFAIGLFLRMRADSKPRQIVGTVGALVLAAEGIFGLVTLFFPEDAGGVGAQISATGSMHIIFASLSSLTTMLAILLVGLWFRSSPRWQRYAIYSFISLLVVFVAGGMAAASIANRSPFGGLAERTTIGGFMQWVFVVAWTMYASEGTSSAAPNN